MIIKITKAIFNLYSTKQKRTMIGLVFMMLIGGMLESVGVTLIMPLMNTVMDESGWDQTWYAGLLIKIFGVTERTSYIKLLLVLLMIVFVVKNLYLLWQYYSQYSFVAGVRYDLQSRLMHKYLRRPYEFYLNTSSGEIVKIVTTDTNMVNTLITNLLRVYTEVIVAIVLAITIFLINTQIAMVLMVVLLLEMALIVKVLKPVNRKVGKQFRTEMSFVNRWVIQSIQGIKSIKVSTTENFFENNYKAHTKSLVNAYKKSQTLANVPQVLIEAVTVAAVLLYVLIKISVGGEIESIIPALSAFVVAAIRLLPSANRMGAAINNISFNEGALYEIIDNIDVKDENTGSAKPELGVAGTDRLTFSKAISFDHITFSYPGGERKILDDASFSIRPGESVGIIGPSGAGKTTSIDIVLGLLKPQSGKVLVDGVDIESNMRGWLSILAYIPQQIFMLDSTIRANVAFGMESEKVSDDKIWKALKEAQLDEFVRTLPDGLDTTIGEAGVRLSGGQRQRIGIARALYNDPEILFFDEATSSLDNETESAIMSSINHLKGCKTLIIIAHRLSTIENCDTIYKVENGSVSPTSI